MAAIFFLVLSTIISIYYIYKNNPAFWAFVLFYQHIPLVIFYNLDSEIYGYGYFISLVVLYLIRNPLINFDKQNFTSPIALSIYLILFMFFFHYVIIGIIPYNDRGFELVYRYLLLNVPIIIICLLYIVPNEDSYENILYGIVVYGVVFLLVVLLVTGMSAIDVPDRDIFRKSFRVSPLLTGQVSGIIIIASSIIMLNTNKKIVNIFCLFALLLSIFLMIISASRGALIFLLITMLMYFIIRPYKFDKKLLILASLFGILVLGFIIATKYDLQLVHRLQALERYESFVRFQRIEIAIDMINNFEMGLAGFGPFGFGYRTGLNYPHNYILELIVDYGFVGFISVCLLLGYGSYYSYRILRSKVSYRIDYIAPVFIYFLLGTLTTGDVVDARQMHFTGILLANIYIYSKKQEYEELSIT